MSDVKQEDVKESSESSAEETKEETVDASTDVEETSDDSEEESTEDKVDYKSELERLTTENEKLGKVTKRQAGALREERKLRREAESKLDEPEDESNDSSDESSVDDSKDIESLVAEAADKLEQKRIIDDINDMAEDLTDNPDEKKLIMHIYENKMRPSGFSKKAILSDLIEAQLIANKPKFMADAEKKVKKNLAERQAMMAVGGKVPSAGKQESDTTNLSREEKKFLRRYGVTNK